MHRKMKKLELPDAALYDIGVFHLLCLGQSTTPTTASRLGLPNNLNERLRHLRCSVFS